MTDRSTDYIYSLNEEIIIRDIESKGELGTLKITNAVFLKEEPFELPELEEYSEDWTPIYKNVRYEALVQINYIGTAIDSRNKITSDNFSITDSAGESVKFDPVMEYELIETEESTIVVALKNKGDYINIDFSFHNSQSKPTAKIKAKLYSKNEIQPPAPTQAAQTPAPSSTAEGAFPVRPYISYNQLSIICIVLLFLVAGLSVALGIVLGRLRK